MNNEKDQLEKDYRRHLLNEEQKALKMHENEIQEFIIYARACGLSIPLDAFSCPQTIGIVVRKKAILSYLIPDMIADKEGLFSWTDIAKYLSNKNRNGFFYHEKFMVMFHPFFRRNFSENANYAPGIVSAFIYEGQKLNQVLSIALDINRLRINVDNTYYAEYDTWFGPQFYNDIEKIPDGPVKLSPPQGYANSLYERWFSYTKFLDILWTSHQNIRKFQLEEIKEENITINYCGGIFHPVRYIHAEFDVERGCFRHLDGAVHLYNNDEFKVRIVENLNINVQNFRNTIKPLSLKLFKINGQIPTDQFISYCSLFLPHNPLIHEYFAGELPEYCVKAVKYYQSQCM